MQHFMRRLICASGVIIAISLCACTTTTTSVKKTVDHDNYKGQRFNNVLVIAVADDYNNRAQFERNVVAGIRASGAQATAYYTVLGHNPPVTVSAVKNAVRSGGYDAVLFTRVKGSAQNVKVKDGPATAQSTVKGGNVVDLFRYDYEEYDEPENVRISTEVTLTTELYSAAASAKIWAVESNSFDRQSVQQIVDNEARSIVKALNKDKLIGPE